MNRMTTLPSRSAALPVTLRRALACVLLCAAMLNGCSIDEDGQPAKPEFTGLNVLVDRPEQISYGVIVNDTASTEYRRTCLGWITTYDRESFPPQPRLVLGEQELSVTMVPGPFSVTIYMYNKTVEDTPVSCKNALSGRGGFTVVAEKTITGNLAIGEELNLYVDLDFFTN